MNRSRKRIAFWAILFFTLILIARFFIFQPDRSEENIGKYREIEGGIKFEPKSDRIYNENTPVLPNGIGVNIHDMNENDIKQLSTLGVKLVRIDLSWHKVETSPGQYDFSQFDRFVELLDRYGMKPYFIFSYSNKLYEQDKSIQTQGGLSGFSQFVKTASERYKDRGAIWEIWNEPNVDLHWSPQPGIDDYAALVNETAPIIKQADPTGTVSAPAALALTNETFAWLEKLFQKGVLEQIDAVSVHPYRKKAPESVINEYARLRELIKKYSNKELPVFSGEWGYSTTSMPADFAREKQAEYLVRMLAVNQMAEIPVSIWYGLRDNGTDPKVEVHNYGLLDSKGKQKPAYAAYKTFTGQLSGFHFKERINTGNDDDYVLVFEKEGRQVIVYWTTSKEHDYEIEANGNTGKLVSLTGESSNVPLNGKVKLKLKQSPSYIRIY
ncbi:cellulase family glycosylhydrolase [Bacillus gobiensis]|uniref:cellulase family glycosylhydrolase n=1 Tax=Bacillus gobiensis TaxID=1441095 RepID=UPI003D1F1C42